MPIVFGLSAQLTTTAIRAADVVPSFNSATEAINKVFGQHHKLNLMLPLSDQPVYTSVRPLSSATIKPLYGFFSAQQRMNIDAFVNAVDGLVSTRNRLAKALGIEEKWWWPTGIDRLRVDALLTQDLLTGRSEKPDEMSISSPKQFSAKLEFAIYETFTEHGQDRVLGLGQRVSIVTLIRQKNRWVIDQIKTTNTDAYGDRSSETLTDRLQDATRILDDTQHAIDSSAKTLEIRKGVKLEN